MKVRITTTYKSTTVIDVPDTFDPDTDDLHPLEFEGEALARMNAFGILDRVSTVAEYEFA